MVQKNLDITVTTACPYFSNTGMFKGVKTGMLFPLLDEETVANRIVQGILQEEGEFTIPWSGGVITHFAKTFLPSVVQIPVIEALVGLGAMNQGVDR